MNANPSVSKTVLVFAAVLATCGATGAQAEYLLRAAPEEAALARNICSDVMRIQQGFVPFDACVESLSGTLRQKSASVMDSKGTPTSYAITRPEQTSYSESNPEERRRKEEYACVHLGILPGSGSFGQCVAQLDSALRSTERSD